MAPHGHIPTHIHQNHHRPGAHRPHKPHGGSHLRDILPPPPPPNPVRPPPPDNSTNPPDRYEKVSQLVPDHPRHPDVEVPHHKEELRPPTDGPEAPRDHNNNRRRRANNLQRRQRSNVTIDDFKRQGKYPNLQEYRRMKKNEDIALGRKEKHWRRVAYWFVAYNFYNIQRKGHEWKLKLI